MRILFVVTLLIISVSFLKTAQAQPPLWENNFGTELTTVSNEDDGEEEITLPFAFSFNGSVFNTAYVGSNGCIQLGGLGLDDDIDYDHWLYMEEFLADSDPDNPEICPFNTDLDPSEGATIYYNDSMDPVVITWDMVSSYDNNDARLTFQILLYSDGRIILNYNGILIKRHTDRLRFKRRSGSRNSSGCYAQRFPLRRGGFRTRRPGPGEPGSESLQFRQHGIRTVVP
jgi:hypothetical protein